MTLEQMKEQLVAWLGEFRFGFDYEIEEEERADKAVRVRIYTLTNRYSIAASPPNYLGCIARTRKPRAGEDWTRGNDLPDGPFCREIFDSIVRAIVGYETVEIHRREPGIADSDEVKEAPVVAPTGC